MSINVQTGLNLQVNWRTKIKTLTVKGPVTYLLLFLDLRVKLENKKFFISVMVKCIPGDLSHLRIKLNRWKRLGDLSPSFPWFTSEMRKWGVSHSSDAHWRPLSLLHWRHLSCTCCYIMMCGTGCCCWYHSYTTCQTGHLQLNSS